MGGSLPARRRKAAPLEVPPLSAFEAQLKGTEEREISTTMAFVRILNTIIRDKKIGKLVVPIVPDESRTFGMEGMFRQLGIYSHVGQLYKPAGLRAAHVLQGRQERPDPRRRASTRPGAMSSWIAAATSYSTHGQSMIPFYIFYSMFGFQRVGDLAWAAGDMRARGFLMGGTAGRTTLNGEGLQHEDGHSHILASTIPNCISYDPTFAYELAVIIQDGMRRMYQEQEDVYYYITVMNENYTHPAMPEGVEKGILKGMYLLSEGKAKKGQRPKCSSSAAARSCAKSSQAPKLLEKDFGIAADIWSATSFNLLRRDGLEAARWNMLHPEAEPRVPYVEQCLKDRPGPVIAATDYMKVFADQIRAFLPTHNFVALGTDGFGRSDTRKALRRFFEVDRHYVAVAAMKALADEEALPRSKVTEAIRKYGIDPEKPDPTTV